MIVVALDGMVSGMEECKSVFQFASVGWRKSAPDPEPKGVSLAWLRCCWLRFISRFSISVGSEMDILLWIILVNGW